MKLFNRKKSTVVNSSLPPEVQAYSQAEHRERMGMAWLVGVVSLVVTAVVLMALFFGGRWVYRKIVGTSAKDTNTSQSESAGNDVNDTPSKESDSSKKDSPAGSEPTTPPVASPTPTPAVTPAQAPVSPDLPRTGPDSDE